MLSSSSRRAAAASERAAGRSRAPVVSPALLGELLVDRLHGGLDRRVVGRTDRDHEVVRAGVLDP